MSDERALVVVLPRALRGVATCARCRWPVAIDDAAAYAVTVGAQLLCLECSHELFAQRPDGFERADL